MSIQFSDLTYYKGLVQIYERELGFGRGEISGDTDKLKEFTADANMAVDDIFRIGFNASGTWQLDDTNQTDYPIIYADIKSGQRDYPFLTDGSGNLILDIYRVMVADNLGTYREIYAVDQATLNSPQSNTDSIINELNASGIPTRYDKTGNSIFLDVIPNYNFTKGLKIFINREPTYFTFSDTTKFAGLPGNLHRYLALKPAKDYARRKTLACYDKLAQEVLEYEQVIIPNAFGNRQKDFSRRLNANVEFTR